MKWQFALAVLAALSPPTAARGLKTPKGADAFSGEATNEALTQRNTQLEAMMLVARKEVHRMDLELKSKGTSKQAEDLQKKLQVAESEKNSLMQTLRQMLAKNSTRIFRKQAEDAVQAQQDFAAKCSKEQEALREQIKEQSGAAEEGKEMVQTLQEQNMELQKTVQDLKAKLAKTEQAERDLTTDKVNLVETMRGLMRETTKFKKALQEANQKEKNATQALAVDEAKLAKLALQRKKKSQPVAAKASRKTPSKNGTAHLKHEESTASKIAKMNHINRYIDRANVETASDDDSDTLSEESPAAPEASKESEWSSVNQQVDALVKKEDLSAQVRQKERQAHAVDKDKDLKEAKALTQPSAGLSNWLGLKTAAAKSAVEGAIPKDVNGLSPIDALDPEAVKKQKVAEVKKAQADADDGGDGIEKLLAQAKDQLSAMDRAEAHSAV